MRVAAFLPAANALRHSLRRATSLANQSSNSVFRVSIAASARMRAAVSRPPWVPPTLAFNMFGGMNSSMGCCFLMDVSSLDRCRFGRRATLRSAIFFLASTAAARAEIDFGAHIRARMFDHRDQSRQDRFHRHGLGEEFVDTGVARLAHMVEGGMAGQHDDRHEG